MGAAAKGCEGARARARAGSAPPPPPPPPHTPTSLSLAGGAPGAAHAPWRIGGRWIGSLLADRGSLIVARRLVFVGGGGGGGCRTRARGGARGRLRQPYARGGRRGGFG